MQGFWGEKVPDPCAAASKKPYGDERAALHGSPRTWCNGEGRVANGEASAWRLQLGVCPQRSNATVDTAEDDAVVVDGGAGASAPGSHEVGTNMAVWDKLNARKAVVEELGRMVTRCSRDDGEDADMLRGVGNASDEGDDTEKTSTEGENDAGSETGNTTSSKHGVYHESVGLKHRGDMIGRKDSEKGRDKAVTSIMNGLDSEHDSGSDDNQCSKAEEQMTENKRTWELAVKSGAILYDQEEDIMAILQAQNEENAQKRRMAKQRVKARRCRPINKNKGCDSVGWEYIASEGASGGLLLMWDESMFKMHNCYKGERWMCIEGVLLKNNFNCAFFLVYGAHARDEKTVVLEGLSYIAGLCQVRCCFMGDFNEIVQVEERKGTDRLTGAAEEFKNWIQDMHLVDLPLNNRKYTWFRGSSCSRIDRVMVSLEWIEEFPETRLKGGPRGLSDHCPMIVEDTRMRGGPRPFRSLDSWFTHEGFLRMVKEEWRDLGEVDFTDKLKALTIPLRRWHKDNFADMDNKILQFENELNKIDDMVSSGTYDGTVEARRKALVTCCERWYVRKKLHWKQMSRSKHAKDMDKNTRYFHQIASSRRRNNRIDALVINERLIRNSARIKIAIREFYRQFYHQEKYARVGFRDGLVARISEEVAMALEVLPSAEEIRETARLPKDSNITWVALAPKFGGAKEIKDFRPISMVGCVYKVISNVLVRRMRAVMPELVGETQSAFVKGRKIHDGALIACETVQWLKLRKKAAAIIKLDFQKAYDRVK
nr:uncharacterized protein LOC112770058 [Arachis hypogaea]